MDRLAQQFEIQVNPEAIPYFLVSALMAMLAYYGFKNRQSTCGLSFGLMTCGSAIWAGGLGMELISVDLSYKSGFLSLAIFGGAMGANWTYAFVRDYKGRKQGYNRFRFYLFFLEPLIVLGLAITNPVHKLFWTYFEITNSGRNLVISLGHGPLFGLHVVFCMTLLIMSLATLVRMGLKADQIYRVQIFLLALAILIPIILVFFQVVVVLPAMVHFRIRLFGLFLGAILLMIALRKFRLLNITPAARESVFRAQKDAVIIFDTCKRVVDANPAAIQFLGAEILGQEMSRAFHYWPELGDKLASHSEGEWEIEHTREDNQSAHFDIRLWPIEEAGLQVGSILTLRDVTSRWNLQSELLQAKEEAEASNRAKSAFLANMSHEIRTPLGAISGYGDILIGMEEPGSEKWSLLRQLKRNSSHLMQVIDDILDLSKIEAGKMDLDLIPYSPWQVMMEAHASLAMKAMEKNLLLELNCQGLLPTTALIDPTRIRQVLFNLLSNAIKFTESGRRIILEIGAQTLPNAPDQIILSLKVTDQGIGMDQTQIRQLFQPFQQADCSTSRRFGGTGLGLSIIHKLVKMMGGTIDVESAPGKGSTFLVSMPCRLASPNVSWIDPLIQTGRTAPISGEKSLPKEPMRGRLLLAEDNPDNQKIILHQLKSSGMEIAVANNGLEAMELAMEKPFEIILMDMQMPECDGYSATSRLRRAGYLGPIIALTANAMKQDREKCLEAGCSDYLAKPVTPDLLLKTIRVHLHSPLKIHQPATGGPASFALPIPPVEEPDSSPFADDPEYLGLVKEFAVNLATRARELNAAFHKENIGDLKTISHQLKSSGKMYGFPEISLAAARLEESILEGSSRGELNAPVKKMVDLMFAISARESITGNIRDAKTIAKLAMVQV